MKHFVHLCGFPKKAGDVDQRNAVQPDKWVKNSGFQVSGFWSLGFGGIKGFFRKWEDRRRGGRRGRGGGGVEGKGGEGEGWSGGEGMGVREREKV